MKNGSAQGRRFLCAGILLLTAFYLVLLKSPPEKFFEAITDMTGRGVVAVSTLLGIAAVYGGQMVTVAGFGMNVSVECTALHFLIIYAAAVLAYPAHDLLYKAKGLLTGTVLLLLLNMLRITGLGLVGAHVPAAFDIVHNWLWQALFSMAVLGVWLLWVQRAWPGRLAIRFAAAAAIGAACAVLLISFLLGPYLRSLAFIADNILALPVFGLQENTFTVTAVNGAIAFQQSAGSTSFPISTDIYDASLFIALMAGSAHVGKREKKIQQFAAGMSVLFLAHIAFSVIVAALVLYHSDEGIILDALWMIRFASIFAPVALWALLTRKREPSIANAASSEECRSIHFAEVGHE